MVHTILMKTFSMILLGFILLSTGYAAQSGSRLESVQKLLETSSAAQQIKGSNNQAAKQMHAEAVSLYEKAKRAQGKGDEQQAADLLKQATKAMFEATRMIKKDESFLAKDVRDFDERKASVDALCTAYENIAKEKGIDAATENELHAFVYKRVDQAEALKQENRVKEGRKMLDEAYVAAKVAIEHLRGGETLVRSLNFASSEEEYHYEVDRNDTHRMLVDVLLKEKMKTNWGIETMVNKFMDRADELRARADEQASDGAYENAVTTLEQSTKEIVRAIRSAGIYIPG
jgi:tetratricopeptide (TPR) repeat protein